MRWPGSRSARPSPGSASDVLIKGVTLFLVGMVVLAMFGKLRFPGRARLAAAKCPGCGRFRIGKGPCGCGAGPGGPPGGGSGKGGAGKGASASRAPGKGAAGDDSSNRKDRA